ncbi:LCP family protein [Xylanimonas protaetiae]|uniref:LytR family transcriptional regulator n=1 Tax=Xylanimonas protaetiae TaxID=2509457 RepID=A0A4P6EZP7_9MICO|nr:LCP family protein [Xylanimonas protaetiae]QAY68930.1 LytR family transcriptional regulator [Xylanimonas protaetiae]
MSDRQIPPSFIPSGSGSRRPPASDDAVTVGPRGQHPPHPERRIQRPDERPDDAVPASSEPRVRRQSSREIPVTPAPRRSAARPASVQPGSAPRGAAPRGAAPRVVGGGTRGAEARAATPRAIPPRPDALGAAGSRALPAEQSARRAGSSGAPAAHAAATRPATRPQTRPGVDPSRAPRPDASGPPRTPPRLRIRKRRVVALVSVLVLLLVLAWPVGLLIWANGKIVHTEALSGAGNTPGTTYLLAGSDERGSGGIEDETTGSRTDTIMLLHKPSSGPAALISLPRDSFVEIPGHGSNKLNAAFSWGGAPLLVQTVEHLTGLTVDHYVEVGFGGIADVVDAVGGVNLCLDLDVNDANSGLVWTSGCHDVDGTTAIAFSRMRYSDPKGDIGRTERQRQLIAAVSSKIADPGLLVRPGKQVSLADAGIGSLTVSEGTNILDFASLALAFRAANGPGGITGTPWIRSLDFRPGHNVGSTVQLDADRNAALWTGLRDGTLEPGVVGGVPQ